MPLDWASCVSAIPIWPQSFAGIQRHASGCTLEGADLLNSLVSLATLPLSSLPGQWPRGCSSRSSTVPLLDYIPSQTPSPNTQQLAIHSQISMSTYPPQATVNRPSHPISHARIVNSSSLSVIQVATLPSPLLLQASPNIPSRISRRLAVQFG